MIPQENKKSAVNLTEYLLTSGFSPNHNGFTYIREALELIREDHAYLKAMTKPGGLYNTIAEKYDSTLSRVERGIRFAIAEAAKTRVFRERFGGYIEHLPLPPNNSVFLALVTELLS